MNHKNFHLLSRSAFTESLRGWDCCWKWSNLLLEIENLTKLIIHKLQYFENKRCYMDFLKKDLKADETYLNVIFFICFTCRHQLPWLMFFCKAWWYNQLVNLIHEFYIQQGTINKNHGKEPYFYWLGPF